MFFHKNLLKIMKFFSCYKENNNNFNNIRESFQNNNNQILIIFKILISINLSFKSTLIKCDT